MCLTTGEPAKTTSETSQTSTLVHRVAGSVRQDEERDEHQEHDQIDGHVAVGLCQQGQNILKKSADGCQEGGDANDAPEVGGAESAPTVGKERGKKEDPVHTEDDDCEPLHADDRHQGQTPVENARHVAYQKAARSQRARVKNVTDKRDGHDPTDRHTHGQ